MRPDSKYKEKWKGFIDFLGVKSKRLSTGEDRIESILTEFNIEFIREKNLTGVSIRRACRSISIFPV